MKRLYFTLFLFPAILLSCKKSNKQQLSLTEQNLTNAEWKWRYTDTATLQANQIINSIYTKNNGCIASISFYTNGTYDEKYPCTDPTLTDYPGKWKLINDSTLSLGFSPMKIIKLTNDTLQFVTETIYFEKGTSADLFLDSIQTRETYSH